MSRVTPFEIETIILSEHYCTICIISWIMFFKSEKDMQVWLSNLFEKGYCLADIIMNYEDFTENFFHQNYPDSSHQKIVHSFNHCLNSFENHEVLVEDINISLDSGDILRPDFLLYSPKTESILIVELKNIKESTRQAATEIGAYAGEIRSYLPFLAEGDLVNVVISSEWPTLLCHFIYNEIVWLNKSIICLEPTQDGDGIALKIVDPLIIFKEQITPLISANQLGGYQICLYDNQILNGGDYMRLEEYEDSMLVALHAMSAKGNSLKAHGFAFLWRHCFDVGLAPYNITVINFVSFQTPILTMRNAAVQKSDFGKMLKKVVRDHCPEGHSKTLDIISDYSESFLKDFCSPMVEGYSNWKTLKPRIFNNTDAIAFVGWGIFQDRLFDRLGCMPKHEEAGIRFESTNPLFAIEMLNQMISI
ncbi:hypothetical protein ACFO4P_08115 [Epilithonimonas pallida]|nr:hypothetical protein [Epilithonimonas pallida]